MTMQYIVMAKLSLAQMYLIGLIQRENWTLHVNRPSRVGILKPAEGIKSNDIYITLAQAESLVNREAVVPMSLHAAAEEASARMGVGVYQNNHAFEKVPVVKKYIPLGKKRVEYYIEK